MNLRRPLAGAAAVLSAACALALGPAPAASAHPLGNFTVNRYDGLVAAPGLLRVDHVEDLAEIPATQAKPDIERLGIAEWARRRCATAARDSALTVDGRAVPLTAGSATAHLRPGQAGLDTLRVECAETARLPKGAHVTLGFHSAGASSGPGWREITARGDRMTLTASDVPKRSASHRLTVYPKELLSSPADTSTARLRVRAGGPALAAEHQDAPAASVLPRGADRWTQALNDLVARHDLTFAFAALALLIAVGLGALHALAPGHGKTLMAATAAARGGRARLGDVLPLAASVTVTHTLGVITLGLLVTAGSAATPSVIAWLGIASGAMVLTAGANLVRRAWRNRTHGHESSHAHGHGHGHTHPHPHTHDRAHEHEHEHARSHAREHTHEHAEKRPLALAAALPGTPSAHHTPELHHHEHEHGREHGQEPEHDHDHALAHSPSHTHGGHTHTHSTAPTLRGTILLGFAGGLVPSPSAVVVLVGAAALGQAWFGLLLVVAYGVGLALTLTAAGFAVVRLGSGVGRLLDRRPRWTTHPVAALARRTLPLASALVVVALGAGLVLRGAASALG
ncbi:nickel transporter [Streptomyces sp. NBC_00820]|uniref:HoxN/HupN/NixA family nickel/cobalt transporter n=1 Tax=Streptomyces sp. NBC_00820 TaxID=2975842 RepID=UPI002ED399E1|nr:nickel transporter [Streptomyces sp. NBC_00820]